jgi:hypothetical protein
MQGTQTSYGLNNSIFSKKFCRSKLKVYICKNEEKLLKDKGNQQRISRKVLIITFKPSKTLSLLGQNLVTICTFEEVPFFYNCINVY